MSPNFIILCLFLYTLWPIRNSTLFSSGQQRFRDRKRTQYFDETKQTRMGNEGRKLRGEIEAKGAGM